MEEAAKTIRSEEAAAMLQSSSRRARRNSGAAAFAFAAIDAHEQGQNRLAPSWLRHQHDHRRLAQGRLDGACHVTFRVGISPKFLVRGLQGQAFPMDSKVQNYTGWQSD